ncbi:N-acetylmuramoyl-L-alanine amidase-like domain-containing protein [Marinomonas transparens]|uniref:DUF1460 domain-containing protein n=1 Tax=Marinomonas transparens TaxID=2795388 RepID=A0A934JQV6_9GAMM|nr:N-acetylmuramoyl-L-alanine amidase-like domain-containing protein [Marinomonas transparens]MBJ7536717.1 DUF1460 domain-containing protein [Marinomonas transparens]
MKNNVILNLFSVFFGALFASFVVAAEAINNANAAAFYAAIESNNTLSSSVGTKVESLSATLLETPYGDGSLGEGENGLYDKDPLIRFDVFDCTTYVEAVLAGAISTSIDDFMPNLMALRYRDGKVSFMARNHFPSADWIPNNQGLLTDITKVVAGGAMMVGETVIDKAAWYQKMGKDRLKCDDESSADCDGLLSKLHAEGKAFSPQTATIDYVPLGAVYLDIKEDKWAGINQALLDRIPTGSIINMVRPDWQLTKWIGTNMNVSHQSIAIRKDGRLYLRHASLTHKKVTDEDFIEYFSTYLAGSSLKGFNVQMLNQ